MDNVLIKKMEIAIIMISNIVLIDCLMMDGAELYFMKVFKYLFNITDEKRRG